MQTNDYCGARMQGLCEIARGERAAALDVEESVIMPRSVEQFAEDGMYYFAMLKGYRWE